MKRYTVSILLILLVNIAFSQDFFDALRYSQTNYGGSARSIAMGSAFGALGGDFSSASINPAGMGFYRSGELTFSPTLNYNNATSSFLGSTNTDGKYRFNFDNIGFVGSVKTGVEAGISGFTFGIGFNRLKNFNNNIYLSGDDAQTTLLNYYTDWANSSKNPGEFDKMNEDLAWQTFLINKDSDPNVIEGMYYNDLANYTGYEIYDQNGILLGNGFEATDVKKHRIKSEIETSGKIDEYLFTMGLNLHHKFYVGASLGLLDLEYYEVTKFTEIDNNELSNDFRDYNLRSVLIHSGAGINFKTGLIYRPGKSLRLGLAFHTPNFYTIDNEESKSIVANFDQPVGDEENGENTQWNYSITGTPYQYKFETPLKVIASASYLLGDKGLISVDYEWANYSRARLRDAGDNWDYSSQNADIEKVFNATGNLRIGGEYRITNFFSLRAGYQLMGNPWKEQYLFDDGTSIDLANKNDSYSTYSAGFGYRQQNFFIDFAYRLSTISEAFKVHEISASDATNGNNIASMNYLKNQATITFGFRF